MNYYGNTLQKTGHYFFRLDGEFFQKTAFNFENIPFHPEHILQSSKEGTVEFYQVKNFSVLGIVGGCFDKRPGSVTIFFVKGSLTQKQMIERIKSIPIANKIIQQMSFHVKW
jgi:hypothetical protein